MNKYLIEILKNHSSLILPGIGALMVTNKKTGDIKFNPHLTFNDGALATYIATEEKIDKTEAQNKVAKFTSEIKAAISKGETYDIFQFGSIFKNENGEIAFKMSKDSKEVALDKTLGKVKKSATSAANKTEKAAKDKTTKAVKGSAKLAENVADKTGKAASKAKDKAVDVAGTAKDKTSKIIKDASKVAGKTAGKAGDAAKAKTAEAIKGTAKGARDAVDKVTDVAGEVKNETLGAIKKTGGLLKKAADKAEETAKAASDSAGKTVLKGASAAKNVANKTADTVKSGADKTAAAAGSVVEKVKEAKNTYIPPVNKDKLPEVPKIVAGAASTVSKTVEKVTEKTTETVSATAEYVEKKRRRWWPIILLLLLIGIAVAAYFFRDKIKAYFGWDDKAKVENVNNYPDADGDGIPDFADVDLTGGTDADGDGIDDSADLDYTQGEDADGDGIDDSFAMAAMGINADEEIDPMAMSDEDADGIPDYADINITEGIDENENGIDDRFDAAITMGADSNKDCIDDSLANISLLNHFKSKMDDSDADGIPDYADTDLTGGEDVNKNGIDDAFESVDMDANGDGLNDSILIAMAISRSNMPEDGSDEMTDEGSESGSEEMASDEGENEGNEGGEVESEMAEQAVVTQEEDATPPPVQKSKTDYSATGNYHAIGAAFTEKSNADGYTADMNSKGFGASIIGRFDGLYLVSLKQYGNLGDAKSDLSNMRNTSSKAWIFKH